MRQRGISAHQISEPECRGCAAKMTLHTRETHEAYPLYVKSKCQGAHVLCLPKTLERQDENKEKFKKIKLLVYFLVYLTEIF